jgi:hypothetical protein
MLSKLLTNWYRLLSTRVYKNEMRRYYEISNQKLEIKRVEENGKEVLIL